MTQGRFEGLLVITDPLLIQLCESILVTTRHNPHRSLILNRRIIIFY